jgi:hypothetical protein
VPDDDDVEDAAELGEGGVEAALELWVFVWFGRGWWWRCGGEWRKGR